MPTQLVHPRATIGAETTLGTGFLAHANVLVSSEVSAGAHCQVHYNATIGHDCELGDRVTVLPGANVAGAVVTPRRAAERSGRRFTGSPAVTRHVGGRAQPRRIRGTDRLAVQPRAHAQRAVGHRGGFLLFAFGPLVNLITGSSAYFGIVNTQLAAASLGFLMALGGLAVADLVVPQRATFTAPSPTRTYELFPLVMVGLAGYALVKILTMGPAVLGMDKLARIEAAGPWHDPYLLAEGYAIALYFVARRTRFYRVLY